MSGLKFIATFLVCALAAVALSAVSLAAQGPTRGPVEPARDPLMELSAKHNLDTARCTYKAQALRRRARQLQK